MKPFTRLRVRSSTFSEMGDETKVNLMVGYKELIKSVNSLSLTYICIYIDQLQGSLEPTAHLLPPGRITNGFTVQALAK